ncbi:MAG: hypothetical protein KF891_14015 [Rhizobacter sp.]|nr:hypothetical protein [Rhizobacter sp.]
MTQTFSRLCLAACLSLGAASAPSQTLYRCGSTYSQTPCAADAAPARISAGAAPDAPAASAGADVCASAGVAQLRFPDPESTRVVSVRKAGTEVIQYAGKSLAARRYDITLNTKGASGAYLGERVYACYLSEDEHRLLQVGPARR